MVRIVIYSESTEKAQLLFREAQLYIKSHRVKSELSFSTDHNNIAANIKENKYHYDIFLFDATSEQSFRLAHSVRKVNYIASVIFFSDGEKPLHDILRYRPTSYINTKNKKATGDSLGFAVKEQLSLNPYFVVKSKESICRINHNDIIYLESNHRVVLLHTSKKIISFYAKLSDVLMLLPEEKFIRCHQSYVINIDDIRELNKSNKQIIMLNGDVINISDKYYNELTEHLEGRFLR